MFAVVNKNNHKAISSTKNFMQTFIKDIDNNVVF